MTVDRKSSNKPRPLCNFIAMLFALCLYLTGTAPAYAGKLNTEYLKYIDRYSGIAIRHQQQYSIPASITLAQGLLESGAGKSRLASIANNHFGIKGGSSWEGDCFYQDDDAKDECFRWYGSAEQSYEDHARFLKRKRYTSLFDLKVTDYKGWAVGLKKCGYATDPEYARKLIGIIELYELYRFDTGQPRVADKVNLQGDETLEHSIEKEIADEMSSMHKIVKRNGKYCIITHTGDRLDNISKEFGIKKKKLAKINNIKNRDAEFSAGEIIYLEK